MKKIIHACHSALFLLAFAFPSAHAQRAAPPTIQTSPGTIVTPGAPNEAELLSHDHYKARDGREVHAPAKTTHDQIPNGASAKCRDGTYSFSQHRRGTCSHHGGVGSWL